MPPLVRDTSGAISDSTPTSTTRADGFWRRKSTAAGTVTDGPKSPPIASTAIVISGGNDPSRAAWAEAGTDTDTLGALKAADADQMRPRPKPERGRRARKRPSPRPPDTRSAASWTGLLALGLEDLLAPVEAVRADVM